MLVRGEVRWPREHLGRVLQVADGTSARVFRETVASAAPGDPCFLAVSFRLRMIRGRGHDGSERRAS